MKGPWPWVGARPPMWCDRPVAPFSDSPAGNVPLVSDQVKGFVTGDGVRDGRRPLGAVLARQILFALHLDEPAGGSLKLEGDAVATIQLDRRCGG